MLEFKEVHLLDGKFLIGVLTETAQYGRTWIQVAEEVSGTPVHLISPKAVARISPLGASPRKPEPSAAPEPKAVPDTFDEGKYADGDYGDLELTEPADATPPVTDPNPTEIAKL